MIYTLKIIQHTCTLCFYMYVIVHDFCLLFFSLSLSLSLQSLLCSAHMSEDIAACINELLEEEGDNNTVTITISDTTDTTRSYNSDTKSIISLSLRLLVWPHLNKLTEVWFSFSLYHSQLINGFMYDISLFLSFSLPPSISLSVSLSVSLSPSLFPFPSISVSVLVTW